MIIEPDYPHIILAFVYRGCKIEIDGDRLDGKPVYAAWVNHDQGCAVAVTSALTRKEAVQRAKDWIDQRLG